MTDETQQGQSGENGVAPKQIIFGYNTLDQLTSITRYDYVGVGPMVDIATGAYSYDSANRMTGLAYTGNGGSIPIDSFTFTLDAADRITARDSTVDGEVDYGYDATNQVTSASYTGTGQPPNEAYSYTLNGNRTNAGYQTGTNNQLLSDGTFNYSYDGEGNRTVRTRISPNYASDYRTTYAWDYRNRLTDVEYFDNNGVLTKHVHYVYDTLDHEIGKQVDDTGGGSYNRAEWYVLDVSPDVPQANVPSTSLADPLLEFDQGGNLAYRYLNGPTPAGVDAVMVNEAITTPGQAGSEYFALADQVNTPHEIVDFNSVVVDHIISNTFGVIASESNPAIHHWMGFGGGHVDQDTEQVGDLHRWYDPFDGIWESEDPSGFTAGDANLARFVDNQPTDATDPSGLQPPGHGRPPYEWNRSETLYQLPPSFNWRLEQLEIEAAINQNRRAQSIARQQYLAAYQRYQEVVQQIMQSQARWYFEGGISGGAGRHEGGVAVIGSFGLAPGHTRDYMRFEAERHRRAMAASTLRIQALQAQVDSNMERWEQLQERLEMFETSHRPEH